MNWKKYKDIIVDSIVNFKNTMPLMFGIAVFWIVVITIIISVLVVVEDDVVPLPSPDTYLSVGDSVVFLTDTFDTYEIYDNRVFKKDGTVMLFPRGNPMKGDVATIVCVLSPDVIEVSEFPLYGDGEKRYWNGANLIKLDDYNNMVNEK